MFLLSLLCKGKESFPHGNGLGMGGRKNLLTDYRFFYLYC